MNRICVRDAFAIETEGRVEGRVEGRKEGRGTYDAWGRGIGVDKGRHQECQENECCPPKSLDNLKLVAPASMDVNEQVCKEMAFGELGPYREIRPWQSPPSRIPWNMPVETAWTASAVSAWRGSRAGDGYIPTK